MKREYISALTCLAIVLGLFVVLGYGMGAAPMLNTVMHTAHDLLLNTCFYLMAICVITGAIGRLFVEFHVVDLIEKVLRPLMRPLFGLPGMAALGAVMTFLSDNPAIISLSKDRRFASHFKKVQYISLTNFGTAFGMGLIVIIFMVGNGFFAEPLIGLLGAFFGCMCSTRLMQHFILKAYPNYATENAVDVDPADEDSTEFDRQSTKREEQTLFMRILNSLLDGGRTGVEVGMTIIPGVLIISTLVMVLTFGPDSATGQYTGAAYEGIALLPQLASYITPVFDWLFGLSDPHQVAFPITALGAVGAALSLVPNFVSHGWVDGNAIAVFTAIGMCWSGFLSTHTAMLDSLGYRELTSKAILSHTVGGLVAAFVAHWAYMGWSLL